MGRTEIIEDNGYYSVYVWIHETEGPSSLILRLDPVSFNVPDSAEELDLELTLTDLKHLQQLATGAGITD